MAWDDECADAIKQILHKAQQLLLRFGSVKINTVTGNAYDLYACPQKYANAQMLLYFCIHAHMI